MAPNPADPVVAVAKLLAAVMGVAMAEFLAPHVAVVLAGMVGATFGLMAWRKCSRVEAFGYFAVWTLAAWLFSGSVANLLVAYTALDNPGPLLLPVAAAVSAIGHRWPGIATWALGVVRKMIEMRANT